MMLDFMKYFRNNNPGANNPGALTNPRTMGDDNQYFSGMPSITGGALNNNSNMQNNNTFVPPGMTSNTGNARGSSISQPNDQIDFNEMMIRTGGAMMGGAQQGGLAAFNAATDEYGAIQDANRANALERYNAEMQAQTALDKANAKTRKQPPDPSAGRLVNNEIVRTLNMVDQDLDNGFFDGRLGATGLTGAVTQLIYGSRGYDLKQRLMTIKGNIGFDKLQDMREKSPTGGALGQVSNQELDTLQSVLGSLDQAQSTEQLKYNLLRLQAAYNNVIHGSGVDPMTGKFYHPYREPDPTQIYSDGNTALDNEVEAIINN